MSATTVRPAPRPEPDDRLEARARLVRPRLVLWAGLAALVVVLLATCLLSLFLGSRSVSPGSVLDTFLHYDASSTDDAVVWTLRVPRTVAGIVVGVALGLAGTLIQGVTRNPLADPGLLGVNAGAAFAVVLGISTLGVTAGVGYVGLALAGAAVASVAVYAIGSAGRGGATPVRLALGGAAVTAALTSLTTAVLLTDTATFDQFRFWTVGAIANRPWDVVAVTAPLVGVGVVLALALGRVLNALSLGDDVARSLGQKVGRARALVAVAVVLLCGAATALAGPIAFVGLVVPHVARALTGPDYRWVLRYSLLIAPTVLLLADVVGRLVARPGELQVGIVTAWMGAPFFLLLVRRRRLAEL